MRNPDKYLTFAAEGISYLKIPENEASANSFSHIDRSVGIIVYSVAYLPERSGFSERTRGAEYVPDGRKIDLAG